jgi:hypothetical protein
LLEPEAESLKAGFLALEREEDAFCCGKQPSAISLQPSGKSPGAEVSGFPDG